MSNELEELPNGNDTFLEQFFSSVRLSSNCSIVFHLESRIAKVHSRLKKMCYLRGGGTPYNALHREAPRERGTIFGRQA